MTVDAGPFRLGDPRGGLAPAVLCVHGLTGTPYEVRPPAEALAAAGFYCEGPLLPGHGTSFRELFGLPRKAWVAAVVSAYDALAERRPVAGLVVLAVPLELAWLVRRAVPWLHRIIRHLPKTPAIRDVEARLRHPGYDRMPLGAVDQLLRLAREVRAGLGEITAPVQLIFSRLDPTVPALNAELLQRELGPGERELLWLERSGHVLPVDFEQALVADRVVAFLRRLEKA